MENNNRFILCVIGAHILFVVAHIHRHTQFIKQSFRYQKNEQLRQQLVHKKQELTAQLYALQNQHNVKEYAEKRLGMKPVALAQVKRLAMGEDCVRNVQTPYDGVLKY